MSRIFGIKIGWLSLVNFLIFQWFFVRLGRELIRLPSGKYKTVRFRFLKRVIPLTGWWSDFRFVSGKKTNDDI